jgi:dTDP-4-dehydrorhamnose 3,5-epimerase
VGRPVRRPDPGGWHLFVIFAETELKSVFFIDLEKHVDERGFFARVWCEQEFRDRGLNPRIAQSSVSFNHKRGTLRGMHYQVAPYEEAKLVRCTAGAIYDVVLDLRLHSPTYTRWTAVELTARNRRMLYIPEGCAHGFQTLVDDTEVSYLISQVYDASSARGVRWNDPAFSIEWPAADRTLSDRDRTYPDFIRNSTN